MVSSIDITKPIYGTPTTQSVRDNFHIARDEITDLQNVSIGFVNRSGDRMTGMLTLFGPPVNQNDAATLEWTLRQMHSSVNTLIFIGDYDGANDIILTSGQPQFVVGQPLPPASPVTTQYYFVVKTGHAAPGVGNQPVEGVTQGTFLISNGVSWINFAMTAAEVIAQTVPVSPAITNVPGMNVYDALAGIGQNFLLKTGGTLTGDLILNRNPVVPMGAATKQFVESLIGGSPNEAPQDGFGYVRSNAAWSNLPKFTKVAVENSFGHIILNSVSTSSSANQILGTKDNLLRWAIQIGGSGGADFEIYRYNDAGSLLDGSPVFAISRANGNVAIKHHLFIDPLISTEAHIYGRGPNNPTDALSDTLNIWARSGVGSSVITLRGPSYTPNPNGVEIYTGSSTNFAWKFDQYGGLAAPGNINVQDAKAIYVGVSSLYRGGGNFVINGNARWRQWFSDADGSWRWDGDPNFTLKMQLDGNGNLWTAGSYSVGSANGINYRGIGTHYFAFGWNGNLNCYLDGGYQGDIAFRGWVSANFYDAATSDSRYLYKWGGICTGNLTVNGLLFAAADIMISQGHSISFDTNGLSRIIKDGSGNLILLANNDWRYWWSPSDGAWRWDGYPNNTELMKLDASGNLSTLGNVSARSVFFLDKDDKKQDVRIELERLRQEIETIKGQMT